MTYTNLDLCSKALIKIGANSIASFDEGTAEAEVANNLYQMVCDGMLASYPWNFALRQKKLPRLNATPIADYKFIYILPQDCLRIISAGIGNKSRGLEYRISNNQLHSNIENIVITYISKVAEQDFPPFFANVLVSRLASEFCLSLTESTSRAEFLIKRCEDELKKAKLLDSQQSTPKTFEDFSLLEARL